MADTAASRWVTPRCPGCDSEPLAQWFLPLMCPDPECPVFCWDPDLPGHLFKARAEVINLDLTFGPGAELL